MNISNLSQIQTPIISESAGLLAPALVNPVNEKDKKQEVESWDQNREEFFTYARSFTFDKYEQMGRFISKHRKEWMEQALKSSLNYVFISSRKSKMSRSILYVYNKDQPIKEKIYILFNKASCKDGVIYGGKEDGVRIKIKTIKHAWEWCTTNWFASESIVSPDHRERLKKVIALVKGIEGILHLELIEYTGSKGQEKTRALMPLAKCLADHVQALTVSHMQQLMSTVARLHKANLIHRDIKQDNIFLIGDKALLGDIDTICEQDSGRRQEICGTPWFCSPEHANPTADLIYLFNTQQKCTQVQMDAFVNTTNPSADIWALGTTFYWATIGKPIWIDDENTDLLSNLDNTSDMIEREEEWLERFPQPQKGTLAFAVWKMLRVDPAARMSSEELEKVAKLNLKKTWTSLLIQKNNALKHRWTLM